MSRRRSVLTVGNFDGVHRGHRALLERARQRAAEHDAEVVAATFQRHPLTALQPEAAPAVLTDPAQKTAALLEAGADRIEWLQPDPSVLGLEPRRFAEKMVADHHPLVWLEGPDFRFGKGRAGDVAMLGELGREMGFEAEVVAPVEATLRDKMRCTVKSSTVRWLIAMGRVADAELCLGRPYGYRGLIVEGERRGRRIGFPTANVDGGDHQMPADGVYAAVVELDGREHAAAVSIGVKPTFPPKAERQRVLEAYVLDFDPPAKTSGGDPGGAELYGRTIEVKLRRWLRDQMAFASTEALVEQMQRDVALVRRLHEAGLVSAAELALSPDENIHGKAPD